MVLRPLPYFHGVLAPEWLDDGRNMRLTSDYHFVDSMGELWRALKGTVIDGASIPRFFWRFIGGPFEGLYRKASVIHDYYCKVKTRKSSRVHWMFYEGIRTAIRDAMRKTHLRGWRKRFWFYREQARALFMYLAVRLYGPQFPRTKWTWAHYLGTLRLVSFCKEMGYWLEIRHA